MGRSQIGLAAAFFVSQWLSPAWAQTTYEPYAFTTLAGRAGSLGSNDGAELSARFSAPQGIAIDTNGDVYVADTGNNTIRKITASGNVSTFAGLAGANGSADGTGSAARFELPQGIALDSAGNVYVGDSGNNIIRRITSVGMVTTIAGAVHEAGSTDGPGPAARFYYPIGLASDTAGNIYVVDNGNSTIRKISSAGNVTTLAGLAGSSGSNDGSGSAARFTFPMRVTYDSGAGIIYVADTGNHTIRRVTLTGIVTTVAGSPGMTGSTDGTGSNALFDSPRGVAVDALSNVYVVSTNSQTIRKIRPSGLVTTLGGSPNLSGITDGVGSAARFNSPYAIGTDSAGHVRITDTVNHTIRFGVPVNEALSLTITLESTGRESLTGRSLPNSTVNIMATSDLAVPFQLLVTVMADSTGAFHYEDVATIRRFYRAFISET